MSDMKLVTLRKMKAGQSGKIIEIHGGQGLVNRLDALGIRTGGTIKKLSSMVMRGPVTVQCGRTCVAIGCGMADKIIVELDSNKDENPPDGQS
jgi:Fe2+ transport system protein FeoA